jgi:hypothetical protein
VESDLAKGYRGAAKGSSEVDVPEWLGVAERQPRRRRAFKQCGCPSVPAPASTPRIGPAGVDVPESPRSIQVSVQISSAAAPSVQAIWLSQRSRAPNARAGGMSGYRRRSLQIVIPLPSVPTPEPPPPGPPTNRTAGVPLPPKGS